MTPGWKMTDATRLETRQWFADNAMACVRAAEDGTEPLASHYPVARYRAEQERHATELLAGKWDHTFTFQQRAYWIETGECVALLP